MMGYKLNTIIWAAVAGVASILTWVLVVGTSSAAVEENGLVENSQIILAAVAMILFAATGFLHRNINIRMLYRVLALGGLSVVLRELEPDTLPIDPRISAWFDDPGQVILLSLIFLGGVGIVVAYRRQAWPTLSAWFQTAPGIVLLTAFVLWAASYGFDNPRLHWEYPEEILEASACVMLTLTGLTGLISTICGNLRRETPTGQPGPAPADNPRLHIR